MRYAAVIIAVFALSLAVSFEAHSQSEENNRRIYNSNSNSDAPAIYNSPGSSHGTGGPLSLRQMLQGRDRAASGDRFAYYGDRVANPYGINPGNYALNISAEEIRASRERRNFLAQQRERESINDLANPEQVATTNTNRYNPVDVRVRSGKPGSVYIRREDDFEKPRKVFRFLN
jgi:hypothetical protein